MIDLGKVSEVTKGPVQAAGLDIGTFQRTD